MSITRLVANWKVATGEKMEMPPAMAFAGGMQNTSVEYRD
jgi:hypothetical protein